MLEQKHVIIIGAGFSGLSTAAYLAQAGYKVTVLEKNRQPGGRAFTLRKEGFRFDLGPSWYMMPDVFEEFFADFNLKPSTYYKLKKLDPSYRVFFAHNQQYDLSTVKENAVLFSKLEPGASVELEQFLAKSRRLYELLRRDFLPLSYDSAWKLLAPKRVGSLYRMGLPRSYHGVVKKSFHDPRLQQIMEYLSIFFGGLPKKIPAVYQAMVYAEMGQGVWYPDGGFTAVAKAFEKHAKKQGAIIKYRSNVTSIEVKDGHAVAVRVGRKRFACDYVVAACDYHFAETKLLKPEYQSYKPAHWKRRTYSASALILSIGLDTKLSNLEHHNVFLDTDWNEAISSVYKSKTWHREPVFQLTIPTKTEQRAATHEREVLSIFIPIANGLEEDEAEISAIKQNVLSRIGERAQLDIAKHIVFEDTRSVGYFSDTFNANYGSAAGLSHTLLQSAVFRPKNRSKKVTNLFFAGQDTNPGFGVPLCVLSGKLVAAMIKSADKRNR